MAKNSNKNKKPKGIDEANPGGLYQGDVGAHAANEDPLAFFNYVLGQGGRNAHNTNPRYWDFVQNQGFSGFYSDYQNALGGNKLLNWNDFLGNWQKPQQPGGAGSPFTNAYYGATPAASTVSHIQKAKQRRGR